MNKPADLIRALGRDEIARRIGVAESRVRRAEHEDHLPAAWWAEISAMAIEAGIRCPELLFGFKRANPPASDAGAESSS